MNSPMHRVSYCEVGDRLVFLDVSADRSFCLNSEAEGEFRKLGITAKDEEDPGGQAAGTGPFAGWSEAPRPCIAPAAARQSLLDRPRQASGWAKTWLAVGRLQSARLRLRLQTFADALASFEKAKRRSVPDCAAAGDLAGELAGFLAAMRLLTTRDFCLSHSYAVARFMIERGIDATLIFGVRLGPFAAHCWVQHGDCLLNDRLDTVRIFTPILVL